MKPTNFRKTLIAAALIVATALGTVAMADPQQGGYGMGPGMMGGYGPGYGMGYGTPNQLNLTPEQQTRLNALHEDLAKKNWDLAGKTQEESYKLRNLMGAEKPNRTAITNQYKKLQELQHQQFAMRLDAREKIDGVFTKEQKKQQRRFAPW